MKQTMVTYINCHSSKILSHSLVDPDDQRGNDDKLIRVILHIDNCFFVRTGSPHMHI